MLVRHYSFAGKLVLWALALVLLTAACAIVAYSLTGMAWLSFAASAAAMVMLTVWSGWRLLARTQQTLQTLADGMQTLRDDDYTIGIRRTSHDELGEVVQAFNALTMTLRSERQTIYQRELLLDTVIQTTPLALVLTNSSGTVVYSNLAARQLLNHGRSFEGVKFTTILDAAPAALREAVPRESDALVTLELSGEPEVFHLSRRQFALNTQEHQLFLLKQMTREINAQEVAIWKKVMRVVAHEINNSLAPISSLAHSGKQLMTADDPAQLTRVLETIQERAQHLQGFVEGYARFTRLPKPNIAAVSWGDFIDALRRAVPFAMDGAVPSNCSYFDAPQITQAMINIIKNALEAGSPPDKICIAVRASEHHVRIEVSDRGSGMSPAILHSALLPFYSTKPAGTGLGLALCREIVEAHGGRINLANRDGGGLVVSLWLPASPTASVA